MCELGKNPNKEIQVNLVCFHLIKIQGRVSYHCDNSAWKAQISVA